MSYPFLDLLDSAGVRQARAENGSLGLWERVASEDSAARLRERERAFIAARDSFYMATVSETGWPYVQHRGGPPGFLKVLDDQTLGFPDFRGNRQYLTVGAIKSDDRAALILMDYPNRRRLKLLGRLRSAGLEDDSSLTRQLLIPGGKARPERLLTFSLAAFDWNCPQHITPRYTAEEVETAIAPLRLRLAELEAEAAALRDQLAGKGPGDIASPTPPLTERPR